MCERFIEFLQAGLEQETIDFVNYNIIEWQRLGGQVCTDRQFRHYDHTHWSQGVFDANETAIQANISDAQALNQLAEFKAETSLDMDEEAQGWFDYITTGKERVELTKDTGGMAEFGF
jgi:hypothetical protein